ncbi:hypothetical protein Pmi06nite_83530 [Planotetraspora mira]|uniref:Uncharacterized protein n=1 Tax=Planotetraspora mira TaxID=58121 RepID=A0A8J3XBS2_9ACTN|nr:hypothetical protein Pmi06nite_83530 [Planotetraspora mira]
MGGVVVSLLSAPAAIAVDAVSFLLAGLCKARIRAPQERGSSPRSGGNVTSAPAPSRECAWSSLIRTGAL